MKQITATEEKRLTLAQRQALMPYQVVYDGKVEVEVAKPESLSAVCPSCGRIVSVSHPEPKLPFFSLRKSL